MTPRDFCYWTQGHFELNNDQQQLTAEQVRLIRAHLEMVRVIQGKTPKPPTGGSALKPPQKIDSGMHWDKDSTNYEPGARC